MDPVFEPNRTCLTGGTVLSSVSEYERLVRRSVRIDGIGSNYTKNGSNHALLVAYLWSQKSENEGQFVFHAIDDGKKGNLAILTL